MHQKQTRAVREDGCVNVRHDEEWWSSSLLILFLSLLYFHFVSLFVFFFFFCLLSSSPLRGSAGFNSQFNPLFLFLFVSSLKLIQLSPVFFCLCFYPRTEMTWDNLGSAPLSIDSPTDQNRIKEDVLVISFNSTHLYHPITGLSWRKLWSDKIYSLQTQKLEEWTRPQ